MKRYRYVTITPICDWSLNDLRVFYRAARTFGIIHMTEDEEEQMANEDFEEMPEAYRFVLRNQLDAIDFEHALVHLLRGGFSWECDVTPDPEFQKWLGEHPDDDGLRTVIYSDNENRVKNTLLNEERSDLNGGKTED